MAAFKFNCPTCNVRMVAPSKLPAKLHCPKCLARFTLFPDGRTELRSQPVSAIAEPGNASSPSLTGNIVLEPQPATAVKPQVETRIEPTTVAVPPVAKKAEPPPPRSTRKDANSFVNRLHTLPKPVLFGLYGAIGGLLGLLLLGEICWWLFQPPDRKPPPVRIAVPAKVAAYHGGKNAIPVLIERKNFAGPVVVEVLGAPGDVGVARTVIDADKKSAEIDVAVGRPEDVGVKARSHDLRIRVFPDSQPDKADEQAFQLNIEPLPRRVAAAFPPVVSVYPGDKNVIPVKIARHGFAGPVRLEIAGDAPEKITIRPAPIGDKETEAAIEVAANDAPLGEYPVRLRAVPQSPGADSATMSITVKVVPVPPIVQLALPPSVVVYSGGKNRFGVKIARQRFDGPVHINLAEAAPGLKLSPSTIPAGASDAELEVALAELPNGQPKEFRLRVEANSADGEASTSNYLLVKGQPLPPSLQLAASAKVAVYPGDKIRFPVKIARQRFQGPVRVAATNPPEHVTVAPITIATNSSEGELEANVGNQAPFGVRPLQLQASAVEFEQATTTGYLNLDVVPPPTDLRMTVSPQVEIFQIGKCRFSVRVARAGFTGPVALEFGALPGGVTLPPCEVAMGKDDVIVEGHANAKAEVGKHKITVSAKGGPGADGKPAMTTGGFELDVKKSDKKPPPLDIMFVLDVTGSMQPQINGVRDGIGQFVNELDKSGMEVRVGMVTFRDIIFDGKNAVQVLRFNNEVFTKNFKTFSEVVGKVKEGGGGDPPESSLEGMVAASNQTYRPGSLRILILITDALPQTIPPSIPMKKAVEILKGNKIDQVHLVIPRAFLGTYQALQENSKGSFFDLNEASKKVGGFAGLLPELSKAIARVSVAAGPEMPLAQAPPALPAAKEAPALPKAAAPPPPPPESAKAPPKVDPPAPLVNIVAAPPRVSVSADALSLPAMPQSGNSALQSMNSTQSFAEEDRYHLLFAIAMWTAAMAAGIGLVLVGGQKFYLRRTLPSLSDASKVLLASLLAGFVGGLVGQWFFQSTAGGTIWDLVSRAVAWTLLGGLLGGGLSLFVPNLARGRAILGGCLGGFMGSLGFALSSYLLGPLIGRWMGGAILGFFIGIMIALSEMVFRRIWLEITYGGREVRTVTLGIAPVAVGGDDAAAVYVAGAPPLACRYWIEDTRVLFEDAATGAIAEIQPGDRREVSGVSIAVCSAASARTAGMTLSLSHGPSLRLTEGLPLTADDIPGLEAQGEDGLVALVSRRPSDPKVLLLRNRSKQTWTAADAAGKEQEIRPGLSVELAAETRIAFGAIRGTLRAG